MPVIQSYKRTSKDDNFLFLLFRLTVALIEIKIKVKPLKRTTKLYFQKIVFSPKREKMSSVKLKIEIIEANTFQCQPLKHCKK
jgi:hypothetical protein